VVTVAAPAHIGGTFVGVGGLDLLIDSIERQLLQSRTETVTVNSPFRPAWRVGPTVRLR